MENKLEINILLFGEKKNSIRQSSQKLYTKFINSFMKSISFKMLFVL